MRRWQHSWQEPCRRLCCFSSNCASQPCTCCGTSISKVCGDRFVCRECRIELAPGDSQDVLAFQMCRACFELHSVLHQHAEFCLVRGDSGAHEAVMRSGGLAPWHELTVDSCVLAEGDGGDCAICYCELDDPGNPACTWPGCTAQPPHSFSARRCPKDGVTGSSPRRYAHRDCIGMFFASKAGSGEPFGYCGDTVPVMCPECQYQREAEQWRCDFAAAGAMVAEALGGAAGLVEDGARGLFEQVSAAAEVSVVPAAAVSAAAVEGLVPRAMFARLLVEAAKRMHPQPWIQRIAEAAIMKELATT